MWGGGGVLTRSKWTKLLLRILDLTPFNWRLVNFQNFFKLFFPKFFFNLFFQMETSEQHTGTDLVNFVYYPTSFV